MAQHDPEEQASRLAADSLSLHDPTGWFERLYAAAASGDASVPWDRSQPSAALRRWAEDRRLSGAQRSAVVVGCGFGTDAEFIAGLGFDTVAFDVSPSAITAARDRHPGSVVEYFAADLLDLPGAWHGAFDLVVESLTVQSLPLSVRNETIANIGRMVKPGGTLIVLAAAREFTDPLADGPPWPLTRGEIDVFGAQGLQPVQVEKSVDALDPSIRRWQAEFRRPR
jgi:SAM-dependent methyltransferase